MDELRERRIRRQEDTKKPKSLPKIVKQFDLFPKVDDDYVIQTKQGGYGILFIFGDVTNSDDYHSWHYGCVVIFRTICICIS